MKFGTVPLAEAVGAISVHAIRQGGVSLKKGAAVDAATATALAAAGLERIVVARLEAEDVGEDEAASALAARAAGPLIRVDPAFTGRANLFAEAAGILLVDAGRVDALNAVDESLTLATLPPHRPVVAGEMVGTVKVIPYAVPRAALATAMDGAGGPSLAVAPYRLRRVGVVSTLLPGLKASVVAKTVAALRARLAPAGAEVTVEREVAHDAVALAAILRDLAGRVELVVVFGASAIADRRDVIPAGLEAAGGHVEHFGMPVDPGNLLLLGRIGDVPLIGAPGCARSPKENGFDWVLGRLLAALPVTRADVARMGVGGLLMEIVSRGQPREGGTQEEE